MVNSAKSTMSIMTKNTAWDLNYAEAYTETISSPLSPKTDSCDQISYATVGHGAIWNQHHTRAYNIPTWYWKCSVKLSRISLLDRYEFHWFLRGWSDHTCPTAGHVGNPEEAPILSTGNTTVHQVISAARIDVRSVSSPFYPSWPTL
jgi:hypothetical protein